MYIIFIIYRLLYTIIKSLSRYTILTIILNKNHIETPYEMLFSSLYKNIYNYKNYHIISVDKYYIKFIKNILILMSKYIPINIYLINYEISTADIFIYYKMIDNNIKVYNIYFDDKLLKHTNHTNQTNKVEYYNINNINNIMFDDYIKEIKSRLTEEQINFYENLDNDTINSINMFINKYNLSENVLWQTSFEGIVSLNLFRNYYKKYCNMF